MQVFPYVLAGKSVKDDIRLESKVWFAARANLKEFMTRSWPPKIVCIAALACWSWMRKAKRCRYTQITIKPWHRKFYSLNCFQLIVGVWERTKKKMMATKEYNRRVSGTHFCSLVGDATVGTVLNWSMGRDWALLVTSVHHERKTLPKPTLLDLKNVR